MNDIVVKRQSKLFHPFAIHECFIPIKIIAVSIQECFIPIQIITLAIHECFIPRQIIVVAT